MNNKPSGYEVQFTAFALILTLVEQTKHPKESFLCSFVQAAGKKSALQRLTLIVRFVFF